MSPDLIVDVLGGEMLLRPERRLNAPLGGHGRRRQHGADEHDIVVIGDRADAQRRAVELGVALLVTTYGSRPEAASRGAGAGGVTG